ncbi:zinc finger protein 616-like [Cydia strobilella]|uniref:zinc finger protein 616-like n=1 Tax=Cydia strobilella TaxID=1100964 RepID=UPI003004F0D1
MKPNVSSNNSEYVECNQTKQSENNERFVLTNKCRVCLDAADIPIFGDELTPDISNDIETFGSIEIRSHDNLPKYICESCEKLLQAAVFFRKTAQQTDLQLKSQQYQDDSNTTNNILDTVKPDGGLLDIGDSNADIETENSSNNIKEEIVVEPSYIYEDLAAIGAFNDSFNSEENNVNQNLPLVEDSTVNMSIDKKYTCKTCDIPFRTAKGYSNHKKSVEHKKARNSKKIQCEICFKNVSRAYYSRHVEAHSPDSKDDKLTCPICNKTYNKTYFNYHITNTHNKDKKESERIQCSVCNKSYEKHYYKFHLAIHNNDSSKYVCDACGKSFIQQSAFKRHSLIHGSKLAFKCSLCPYKGRHPGLLKTHMQTHTRDYQHRCMECPARFLTKSNLNKHVQRHKGPVDFKCENCKKGFYSKPELERHYEADHLGVKNHVCNICGKAFGYRNAMMSHQLRVHKREKLTNGKGRLPLYLEADRNNDNIGECN